VLAGVLIGAVSLSGGGGDRDAIVVAALPSVDESNIAERAVPSESAAGLVDAVDPESTAGLADTVTTEPLDPSPGDDVVEDEAALTPALIAPPPQTGTLKLEAEPRVAVYLGEKRIGRTPLQVDLPPGLHELRLVNRKHHLDKRRKVRIRAGRTHKREWIYGLSRLRLDAPTGAKVYVGKRYVGRAPVRPLQIVEGTHRIRIRKGSSKHSERLRVPPSRDVHLRVSL